MIKKIVSLLFIVFFSTAIIVPEVFAEDDVEETVVKEKVENKIEICEQTNCTY